MTELQIEPSNTRIEVGTKQSFVAKGLDQYGQELAIDVIQWAATGGTIDQEGVFLAGPNSGNFNVTATVDNIKALNHFSLFKRSVKDENGKYAEDGTQQSQKIHWKRDVPTQKWMNFYSRVLTRFASDPNLRLTLKVEFSVDGVVSEQKLEETKVALQELGLDDSLDKN